MRYTMLMAWMRMEEAHVALGGRPAGWVIACPAKVCTQATGREVSNGVEVRVEVEESDEVEETMAGAAAATLPRSVEVGAREAVAVEEGPAPRPAEDVVEPLAPAAAAPSLLDSPSSGCAVE
jgi:hypothetical protein